MDLLNDLNDAQRKAVEYISGPSLVIAGAGSGKTRVLTYKIAYLLLQGMKPWNIMALTFTNKAANEMKVRIGNLVGTDLAQHLYMGTFHSIFARILRAEAEHLGFSNNFTIYDETDSRSLLKAIIKELGLDDKAYKPAAVHGRISMAKNNLMSPESYASDGEIYQQNLHAKMPEIGKIYAYYVQRCKQANAMDFDDLLTLTFQLFRDHEEIRKKYADRFDFILVDEYQDTNHVQMNIVLQLCKEKQRVCAVGDDSQSIYSFRGANIDNILNFTKHFDDAKLFKLEQNYRSTQTIVNAANSLIKHNRNQIPKDVFSENDKGEKIQYQPAYSDKEEALIVSNDIKRIKRQDGCEFSDFAILYRTNAQSRSFEEEFRKQGIPYRIYGGLSFYQRKEIKDIIAYFRLVANPDDEEAFKRIINYPTRGIGNTTVQKIAACALDNQVSFWDIISSPQRYGLSVNKGALNKLEAFRLLIAGFIADAEKMDVYELGDKIIKESGISADIFNGGKDADNLARQENLEEFLSGMQTFVEERKEEDRAEEVFLTDYLQDVALLTDLDSKGDDDAPRVSLMTVHAAKGLEFPTVFVVGLEENIFPSPMAAVSARDLEEERRLLYVAITRAEKHCFLTNAKNRFRYGKMEFDNPSRFIDEINPALIDGKEENGGFSSDFDDRGGERFGGYGGRMPWDKLRKPWESAQQRRESSRQRMESSRPEWEQTYSERRQTKPEWEQSVTSQFKPDPKPGSNYSTRSTISSTEPNFKPVRAVNAARRILGETPVSNSRTNSRTDSRTNGFNSNGLSNAATEKSSKSQDFSNAFGLTEGTRIEHQRFGIGVVTKLEGTGENAKATVEFVNSGRKQLLLKFAKYKVIS